MRRQAGVKNFEKSAGTLSESYEGTFTFEYNPNYLEKSNAWVSLTLPIQKNLKADEHGHLFPFFDGLIPEGWMLAVAKKLKPELANDRLGLLIATGANTVGSVTLNHFGARTPNESELSASKQNSVFNTYKKCLVCCKPLSEGHYHAQCAKDLFGVNEGNVTLPFSQDQFEDLAKQNISSGWIIPGAQRKISASLASELGQNSRITLFGNGSQEQFILKPEHPQVPTFPANEHAAMTLARVVGLPTASFGLMLGQDGKFCYVCKRFDRVSSSAAKSQNGNHVLGSQIRKLSVEDFGQIFDRVRDNDKYKGSYDQIGKYLYENAPNALLDCSNFFDQVFISYLIGNNDFHLRNVSVFSDNNVPTLTPAYDLTITQLIDPEPEIDVTLALNGRNAKLRKSDWLEFGFRMGMNRKVLETKFRRFEGLMPTLQETIEKSFLPPPQIEFVKGFMANRMKRLSEI